MEGIHTGVIHEKPHPGQGVMLEKFVEDCLLWEGIRSGKTVRCLPLAERGAAETMCDELITAGEE